MFLNYRKSETDVYTDGTLPPLFHDFAVKINYKKTQMSLNLKKKI